MVWCALCLVRFKPLIIYGFVMLFLIQLYQPLILIRGGNWCMYYLAIITTPIFRKNGRRIERTCYFLSIKLAARDYGEHEQEWKQNHENIYTFEVEQEHEFWPKANLNYQYWFTTARHFNRLDGVTENCALPYHSLEERPTHGHSLGCSPSVKWL